MTHNPPIRQAADVTDGELALAVQDLLGQIPKEAITILRIFRDGLAFFNLPWNPALVDPELLSQSPCRFPTAPGYLAIIGLCWKRNAPIKTELTRVSGQPAKPCQILRDVYGFVFAGNDRRWTFRDDGVEYRRIQGLAEVEADERRLIVLSPKGRKRFLAGKVDPFLGTSATLEIDHRTPVMAARKLGLPPDTLSDSDLDDGSADERFQALNKITNARKREVCLACLDGAPIAIPPMAALGKPKDHWRIRFDDPRAADLPPNAPPCLGCIWHRPELSFEEAKRRWQNQHPKPPENPETSPCVPQAPTNRPTNTDSLHSPASKTTSPPSPPSDSPPPTY